MILAKYSKNINLEKFSKENQQKSIYFWHEVNHKGQKYGKFDLIFISAVLYVLDEIRVKNLFMKLAISSKTIVIMDEIENCFEENTKYIRGKAFRHPYVTWLEDCGFSCVVYRTPIKTSGDYCKLTPSGLPIE